MSGSGAVDPLVSTRATRPAIQCNYCLCFICQERTTCVRNPYSDQPCAWIRPYRRLNSPRGACIQENPRSRRLHSCDPGAQRHSLVCPFCSARACEATLAHPPPSWAIILVDQPT
ncbi:hypothetical protein HPB50_014483 [Hyalomma asiaticum]|uniref:Uncharacterized protein n=1 Tax=Hyalomma asiaticum TaxID=266040 RepID=A0ACB7SHI6_HYAAI|nr:hypothetical protein HPB50_014483 [Hyalomma asiaticum]